MNLYYDLHLHSCLSPCGDEDMTPGNIVGMAAVKGLDVIALTDHNSCKNCPAAMAFGEAYGVLVIPGMELTTSEEIHAVCLFETLGDALKFDAYVYEHLMPVKNREDIFGKQQIRNEEDEVVGTVENLLIGSTDISFEGLWELVDARGGVMFPAHLDKSTTSLISSLGFVPPDSKFTCAEIKNMAHYHRLKKENPYLEKCLIVSDSDAHYLQDINEPGYTLEVKEKSIRGVLEALRRGIG